MTDATPQSDQQRVRSLAALCQTSAGDRERLVPAIASALAAVRAESAARIETLEAENALLRRQVPRVTDDDGGPEY